MFLLIRVSGKRSDSDRRNFKFHYVSINSKQERSATNLEEEALNSIMFLLIQGRSS